MAGNVITELENAAHVLLAPPSVVSKDQRKSAEQLFLNFRQTKSPYALCRFILENSSVDYVLFEAADLLKDAIVHEWKMLPEDDIIALRQYLLNYIIQRQLAPFVKDRIILMIAVMIKRASADDFGRNRGQVLTDIENLILNGDASQKLLGCCLLLVLIQEFASTTKSSNIGLSLEQHTRVKSLFESTDMKRIFQFSVRILREFTKENVSLTGDMTLLLKHMICIAETVLTWSYSDTLLSRYRSYKILFRLDEIPKLWLGSSWKEVILDPEIINLFFTLYWKVRFDQELLQHCSICLSQLASLNGPVFDSEDSAHAKYVGNFINNFLTLVSRVEIFNREAFSIAEMVNNITFYSKESILFTLPTDLQQSFLQQVARLTCLFAEGAAEEERCDSEEQLYTDAFECMLRMWISLFECNTTSPTEVLQQASQEIFNTYLKARISLSDDSVLRGPVISSEEIDDIEEDDRTRYKTQLLCIGLIGQYVPGHAIPTLTKLLEDRARRLKSQLQKLHMQNMSIADNNILTSLFEDIHWLVLIAGNVLTMDGERENTLIPLSIMLYSSQQGSSGRVNIDKTLEVLASPGRDISDIPEAEDSTDHVIRLIAAVFRICNMESEAFRANFTQFLSPEVGSSLMWFLLNFVDSYLMPNNIAETSMALSTIFGKESQGELWTINFLLEKIEANLNFFTGESSVMNDTIKLFVKLCSSKERAVLILKNERLWSILNFKSNLQYGTLPQAVIRGLYQCMVKTGAAFENPQSEQDYWTQVLKPLQDRFKSLVCAENIRTLIHDEAVKLGMIDLLDSFIGISQGASSKMADLMFQFLHPVLSELSVMIGMFQNYPVIVELILQLYCECSTHLLPYIEKDSQFFQSCMQMIDTYTHSHIGRISKDTSMEECVYNELLLILKNFSHTLWKNIFNINTSDEENTVTREDFCLHGLNSLMPLITKDLLKYPVLCKEYFEVICLTCETHPQKICDLPSNLFEKLFASVRSGLVEYDSDIILVCCNLIEHFGNFLYSEKSMQHHERVIAVIKPLLKLLLDLVISHQINLDSIPNVGVALYVLLCSYQDIFNDIVREVIASQQDPENASRLAKAFDNLLENVDFDKGLKSKKRFESKFEVFAFDVLGFLHIK